MDADGPGSPGVITFLLGLIGFVSIWFDNPTRLDTGVGLLVAGLAFALQKVVTSFAGYFLILRSKTFNVGDRIRKGGVRGDVIALSFIQTAIMEMAEPPMMRLDLARQRADRLRAYCRRCRRILKGILKIA